MTITTPQLALADGQAVNITVFAPPSVGTYPATSKVGNDLTILSAQRATRIGGGGNSGNWYATSGTLKVTEATTLGDKTKWGVIAASLETTMAMTNGSQLITVKGTLGCVIDPIANG